MNLDDYFSEKKDQREGKLPSDDDFKYYKDNLKKYNEGGDARRSIPDLARFNRIKKMIEETNKIQKMREKKDDVEPMMGGGMVMPKKKKKAKAKKMMGGGKVYARGSRKANYSG